MSNLPPGCSPSDIPGNRPEDAAWEALVEAMSDSGLSAEEARARWESQPDLVAACEKAIEAAFLRPVRIPVHALRAALAKATKD